MVDDDSKAKRPALVRSPLGLFRSPPLFTASPEFAQAHSPSRLTHVKPSLSKLQKLKNNQSATSTATSGRRSRASSSPAYCLRTSALARPGAAGTRWSCSWATCSTAGTTRSVRIEETVGGEEEGEQIKKRDGKIFPFFFEEKKPR